MVIWSNLTFVVMIWRKVLAEVYFHLIQSNESQFEIAMHPWIQKKIFLTKLKGHPNLFVTGKFFYSQYRNKEENSEGIEDLYLYRRIFVKSVFDWTIFNCIVHPLFTIADGLKLRLFLWGMKRLKYINMQLYYRIIPYISTWVENGNS